MDCINRQILQNVYRRSTLEEGVAACYAKMAWGEHWGLINANRSHSRTFVNSNMLISQQCSDVVPRLAYVLRATIAFLYHSLCSVSVSKHDILPMNSNKKHFLN